MTKRQKKKNRTWRPNFKMNYTLSFPSMKLISRKQIPTMSIGLRLKKLMIKDSVETYSRGEKTMPYGFKIISYKGKSINSLIIL